VGSRGTCIYVLLVVDTSSVAKHLIDLDEVALGAARATGVFVGNLVMGLLYVLGPAYSYGYAAFVGVAAAGIALAAATRARPEGGVTRPE
jgi:hypothetical protein